MIKTKFGKTKVYGGKAVLLADMTAIAEAMYREYGEDFIDTCISLAKMEDRIEISRALKAYFDREDERNGR